MGLEIAQRPTFVLIARVSTEGVASFQEYEDAVLPLLREFGGLLGDACVTPTALSRFIS